MALVRVGRPRRVLTPHDLRVVKRASAMGLSERDMQCLIAIGRETWDEFKNDPTSGLSDAMAKGKAFGKSLSSRALMRRVIAGDVPAIKWFETTRFGFGEIHRHEVITRDQLADLSDEQLERVAAGESPSDVIGGSSRGG